MLKEIFHDSFENFKITRICMENHWKRDWMAKVVFLIQMLPTFGGRCNCYFWDIWLKIRRLPNFNMLFKLVVTKIFKVNCFRVDRKLITWSSHAKSLIHSKLINIQNSTMPLEFLKSATLLCQSTNEKEDYLVSWGDMYNTDYTLWVTSKKTTLLIIPAQCSDSTIFVFFWSSNKLHNKHSGNY